jgi:DNA repair protein RadA
MRYNLSIETLEEIEPTLKRRLKEVGFHSIKELAMTTPTDVAKSLGIEISEAILICNEATSTLEKLGIIPKNSFIDPSDQSSHHKSFIRTGSLDLDNLFGGNGIETKAITQFYGQSATGKTQLCHTLCVTVQELKAEYKSIYIDTENSFRAERIRQIAEIKNLNPLEALRHLICFQPINSARLESILQQDCSRLLNQDKDIKLLIVDSIINHFRAEYSGRSLLAHRQSRLSRMMHFLQKIARMYDIAVVLTNQVQTAVDGSSSCLAGSGRKSYVAYEYL